MFKQASPDTGVICSVVLFWSTFLTTVATEAWQALFLLALMESLGAGEGNRTLDT